MSERTLDVLNAYLLSTPDPALTVILPTESDEILPSAEVICITAGTSVTVTIQFAMKTLWIHIFLLSILLPVQGNPRSEEWCGAQFSWNEDMKQVKLLEDCDITKDQLTLSDSVGRITDKTECISFIDLIIDSMLMERWQNLEGNPLTGRTVTFENLLHEQIRHRHAKVVVTARNPRAQQMDFQINFNIDSSNCHGLVEVNNAEEENPTGKKETGGTLEGICFI